MWKSGRRLRLWGLPILGTIRRMSCTFPRQTRGATDHRCSKSSQSTSKRCKRKSQSHTTAGIATRCTRTCRHRLRCLVVWYASGTGKHPEEDVYRKVLWPRTNEKTPDSLSFRLTTLANAHRYGHSGWSARLREITYMNTTVFVEDSPCHEYFQHLYVPRVVAHLAQVTNL
jgi:hypothetical protein